MTTVAFLPAVILAGGRSTRMGADKAQLVLGGATLLERAVKRLAGQSDHVAINSNAGLAPALDGINVFADSLSGHRGPLAGILAAMRHAAALPQKPGRVATVAIDSPFFPLDLTLRLASAVPDAATIALASAGGRSHPVFGLWPVALADILETWLLHSPDLSVRGFLARHAHVEVAFPDLALDGETLDPFFNVNTPEEFERAIHIEERFRP